MTDFEQHITRQIAWSRATFGPGTRRQGVTDHIMKELGEVAAAENYADRVKEWTDVAILALDGLWREIAYGQDGVMVSPAAAQEVVFHILSKHNRNELRDWPDWRTSDPNKAIEHNRSRDARKSGKEGE